MNLMADSILFLLPPTSNLFGSNRVYLEKVLLPKDSRKELQVGGCSWSMNLLP